MAAIELQNTSLRDDTNLISYYRFEGNSNDEVGGNNGTDSSMSYSSSGGQFGQYASFNGSNNGSNIVLNSAITTAKTFMVWVYLTSSAGLTTDGNFIILQNSGFYLGFNSALKPEYFNSSWKASSTAVSLNGWHHIAFVSDGSGTTLYLDATSRLSNADTNQLNGLYIGERPDLTTAPAMFLGRMDDMAFFSRALTSTEISNYYNGALGGRVTRGGSFLLNFI